MIRDDQQFGRIGEGVVIGEPARIGMPVRADDGQIPDRGMERAGDVAGARLGGEKAVGVELQRLHERGSERRSEEHTSELQSLMRISYAVFCLTKKTHTTNNKLLTTTTTYTFDGNHLINLYIHINQH